MASLGMKLLTGAKLVQCSSRSLLRTLVPACTAHNQTRLTERCHAFSTSSSMLSVRVQHPAPDFKGQAVVNGQFKEIQLSDFKRKYLVLFFYPLDFTFVCPTEIIAFSDSIDKFKALNTEVIGVSTDSHFSQLAWINTPRKQGGLGSLKYPLLSDFNKTISQDYGVLVEDQGLSLKGLFLIDPSGIVRQITINDLPVGRSEDEVLRLIQAFQFVEKHGLEKFVQRIGSQTLQPLSQPQRDRNLTLRKSTKSLIIHTLNYNEMHNCKIS